jgi:CheY-like chemotaxis protein
MDVVAQRIHAMKGRLDLHSQPGQGCRFSLSVPASAGSQHALLVKVAGQLLALPTRAVQHALGAEQVRREGASVYWREHRWRHARLSDWLGGLGAPVASPASVPALQTKPVVVVQGLDEAVALEVDEVQEARELITQDVGRLLRCVPGLLGGALTREGRVLLLLDPALLEQHTQKQQAQNASPEAQFLALARQLSLPEPVQAPRVLVVEDSLSVRQSLGQLLQDAGWEVHTARDGLEALSLLTGPQPIDVVLTDLEMPRLNGLELTRQLREQARWQTLPVLMLTSRSSDKHRQSALALGVNTYLCKPCPDAQLLAALQALLLPRA